jgi:hypothetical protein
MRKVLEHVGPQGNTIVIRVRRHGNAAVRCWVKRHVERSLSLEEHMAVPVNASILTCH